MPTPSPLHLIEGRHGVFLVNANDYYIGQALMHYGEYSEREFHTIEQLIPLGKDIIEVGANIGSISVPLARKAQAMNRRLLVVEPQPVVFQNLCANLALNGLWNVQAENMACASTTTSLFFSLPDYNATGSNFGGVEMHADGTNGAIRVRCAPLDDLMPESFDVGLIKIDVEGFGLEVLKGAAQTIKKFRPTIYLRDDRQDKSAALTEWLWQAGYSLWRHEAPMFNPNNYMGKPDDMYSPPGKTMVSVNLVALPEERRVGLVDCDPLTPVQKPA